MELPQTSDGFFPKRKSKYLKMLQNYTGKQIMAYEAEEAKSPTENLGKAKKELQAITRNMDQFDQSLRRMKSKLGYYKPKQELVVKNLGELVNNTNESVTPTKIDTHIKTRQNTKTCECSYINNLI